MLRAKRRYVIWSLVITVALAIAAIAGKDWDRSKQMATVTHVHDPQESVTFDEVTGLVTVARHYTVDLYPTNALALSRTESTSTGFPTPPDMPNLMSVEVTRMTRGATPNTQTAVSKTVYCYLVNQVIDTVTAKEDESASLSHITATYEGLWEGVIRDEFAISTKSELLVVDLNDKARDTSGRPRGIGAKSEGVNREVPSGTWTIYENISYDDWNKKLANVQLLTGTVNEQKWKPAISSGITWNRGTWLYQGATFTPIGTRYFQLVHSFDMAMGIDTAKFHRYAWRTEHDETYTPDGETEKRTRKVYGSEIVAKIYPNADYYGLLDSEEDLSDYSNIIAGRTDLKNKGFVELGL